MGTTVRLYSCYDLQKACFVEYMEPEDQDRNYSKLFLASCGDVWLWHPDNGVRRVIHQEEGILISTVFKTEAGNLPDNRVNFVREDNDGRIWIGTKRGLALVVDGEVKIVDRALHFVSMLANGDRVYFLTENGDIYSYQEKTQELLKQAALSAVAGKMSLTDDFRIKDKWVILTSTGVYNYDLVKYTLTPDTHLDIKKGEVICDNRGDYWIYNRTGCVHYISTATGKVKSFQFIPEDKLDHIDFERYHIVHDSRGIIWISTYGNGLFAYDPIEDKLEHFAAGITENSYINSDFLLFVMEDRAGMKGLPVFIRKVRSCSTVLMLYV